MTLAGDDGATVVEVDAYVATIRLNRPPLNQFDTIMRDSLRDSVRRVNDDLTVRACVIHSGGNHFGAGADIKYLASIAYEEIVIWNREIQRTLTSVADLAVPTIAAVTGYALGGGFELALAADFRFGSQSCLLGLPEVTLGILPGSGGTQRLTQIVGRSTAKSLIMTGQRIPAQRALDLGILDEVCPDDAVLTRAKEFAEQVAAAPPHAIRAIKQCVDAAAPIDSTALALESSSLAGLFATRDRETRMAAFLQARSARATP